jgi:hypothetical protein
MIAPELLSERRRDLSTLRERISPSPHDWKNFSASSHATRK